MRQANEKPGPDKPPSRKRIKKEKQSILWHFESMDRVNRAMQGTNDLEQMMKDVLDALLSVFECDRAWLVYPCDPDYPTWQVPMERSRSDYTGVLPIGVELPLDPVGAEVYRILRNTDGPVKFGAGEEHPVPMEMAAAFQVKSFIAMAFYPKIGRPWSFGLHQCSYERVWTSEEGRLFQEIGRRLSDGLTSLLAFRNLEEREKQIEQLIAASPVAMIVSSGIEEHVEWVNEKFIELFGYTVEDMPDVEHWWPLAYPDETYRAEIKAQWDANVERAIREKSQIRPMEATVRCKDGSRRHVEIRFSSIGEKHLVTFVDLTERKRAEDELRQNREATLQFSERLAALQDVTNELSKVGSADELCLQAVQLGRSRLRFDRVSIWFIEEQRGIMRGSFGTDEHGQLRDERNAQVEFRHEGLAWLLFSHKESMAVVEHCPLCDHLGRAVGEGDNAVAALWDGDQVIGVISVDNLFTGQPIRDRQLEILRMYATTLGHLITRKRAEDELIVREREYRALVENTPDLIVRYDKDLRRIYVNPAWEKATGLSAQDVVNVHYADVPGVPSSVNTEYLEKLRKALRTGTTQAEAFTWVNSNGVILFLEYVIVPEYDQHGKIRGVLSVGRDITERKQAEEALRRSEHQFRALAENIPNVVFQCRNDARYSFLYLNDAIEDLTGYPKDEFLENGLSFFDLYHPDDLKAIPTPQENNFTDINRNPFHITYRIRHKSGEWRWVDEWGTGIENTDGNVEFLEGIMIDITEAKQAEEALRESEERYRQLVNLSPDSIAVYSQGRVVFVNPAAVRIAGAQSEQELIGKPILDLVHPDFHGPVLELMLQPESSGATVPFAEEKFLRLDGSVVNVEVAIVSYQQRGMDYMQIVARDITERKRHELEREAIIAVSQALRKATTRTEIVTVILDQLVDLFDADGSMIALPNPPDQGIVIEMGRGIVGERFSGLMIPPDTGVSRWVIETAKPYLNNRADVDPRFYRPDLLGGSHCVASVPLIAREQSIGALWIARHKDILAQELRLLNAIADIAANAIHRVMLHEQTEQQLHRLIALHQIDLAITANFDAAVTFRVILKNVKEELRVDAASLLLLDPVTHTLDYAAGIGFRTRGIESSHVRLGNGYAGRAAQEYHTISGPNLNLSPETFSRFSLLANEGFQAHYATPLIVKGQVTGVLEIFHREVFDAQQEWVNYFETLATQAAIAIENASLFQNLQRSNLDLVLAYDATIEGWSRALDLRDRETEGHTIRVTEMVLELAAKMGMNEVEQLNIKRGALLHDIGKMGVPDSILLKPGPLSVSEWEIMRQHPSYALQMLSPISYLKHALDIPYCHHEKWDGTGYPRGLKGEDIPLPARMFSVVDVFDALTSDRPYRHAWPREQVYSYIQEQAGKYFDPKIVKVFLEIMK